MELTESIVEMYVLEKSWALAELAKELRLNSGPKWSSPSRYSETFRSKKNSIKGDGLTKAIFSLFFLSFKYFKGIKAVLIEKTNMGRDV